MRALDARPVNAQALLRDCLARIEARRGLDLELQTLDMGSLVRDVIGDFKTFHQALQSYLDVRSSEL